MAKQKLEFAQDDGNDDGDDDGDDGGDDGGEFATPVTGRRKKKSKASKRRTSLVRMDVLQIALAGDDGPLKEYISNFDMDRAKYENWSPAQWEKILPAWNSKEKSRGLKTWSSKTARGTWAVKGVCAKVINQAVKIYMEISGLPPVFEGKRYYHSGDGDGRKTGGIDLFTPFILTVHLAYCKYLNPEVEEGMVAFDQVGDPMFVMYVIYNVVGFTHTHMHVCRFYNICTRAPCA